MKKAAHKVRVLPEKLLERVAEKDRLTSRMQKATLQIANEHRFRLEDLLIENNLDVHDPDSWRLLAAIFAKKLKLLNHVWSDDDNAWVKPGRAARGASVKWSDAMKSQLLTAVDGIIKEKKCKPSEAIRFLRKRDKVWGRQTYQNLSNRYSEFKLAPIRMAKTARFAAKLAARVKKRKTTP